MAIFIHRRTLTCLKKAYLLWHWCFHCPFSPLNTGSMFVFQSSISKSTFRAINIPLKEVKERIATAVPDKNDTVKVYCNAGRQSGQAKEILSEMGYTHVENAGGLKDIAMPKVKG